MNEPIPIQRDTDPGSEELALRKQKHEARIQWAFLGFVGVILVGFMVPLVVWLTRLALG